jgi:hypothetical protein
LSPEATPRYTNCIVTCVWAEGVNRTPPVLYTYNAAFRRDHKRTPRRTAQVAQLDSLLRHYAIAPDQAVYIGASKKEERVCVSEPVRRFVEKYAISDGSVVLSDQGTSYFPQGEDALLSLGFKTHACYPPVVHRTYPRTIASFTAQRR